MPDFTEFFLEGINNYGLYMMALATFLGAGGAPVPTAPLVIAGGAFIRQDMLDPTAIVLFTFAGVIAGDIFSYGLGRFAGDWVNRHITPRREAFFKRANAMFDRYGPVSLYLTHSFLTSLDVPANLTAGLSRYPFPRFITFVLAGRITWLILYGTLGYVVGSQWKLASELVSKYTLWLGLALVVILAGVYLIRRRRREGRVSEQR